ncbi:MAG: hypothetical protein IJU95_02120 [Treponema sp.]|nr:hypothetical protein [Treponema sp.]
MISLDQVLLLQKRVETAVGKINFLSGQVEQLKNDNDALRAKCAELTKALDEKTELVSSLEVNQGKIEEGILTALNRLDAVENAILSGQAVDSTAAGDDTSVNAQDSSSDEEVEDDDTAAFDYTGGMSSNEESQELKEVTEEIADATGGSQDVHVNGNPSQDSNTDQSQGMQENVEGAESSEPVPQ